MFQWIILDSLIFLYHFFFLQAFIFFMNMHYGFIFIVQKVCELKL